MNVKYTSYYNYQSKDEWVNNINFYLSRIQSTEVGSILMKKINQKISEGFVINILNHCNNRSFQYPHFSTYENNNIFIPDTPYFIKVPVLNLDLVEDIDYGIIERLKNNNPLDEKLDQDFVKSFLTWEFQPVVIILFHELIHCLRHLDSKVYDFATEEESTIYGINNNTLFIDNEVITENKLRQELGLKPRLSHDSQDYYIYRNGIEDTKMSRNEIKKLFLKEKL